MDFKASHFNYAETNAFSKIVLDYLSAADQLKPFYKYDPSMAGAKKAITDRPAFPVNREALFRALQNQYEAQGLLDDAASQIGKLKEENCFTICTAHQPNIFTGHLYFVYKILHAIKLADQLREQYPDKHFVPVYYMGNEDADLDELGTIHLFGEAYTWQTDQKGAVGKMKIDAAFLKLVDEMAGRLKVEPFGETWIEMLRDCYTAGRTIEVATFLLVHKMFGNLGLLVLIPDAPELKRSFIPIVEKELNEGFSAAEVKSVIDAFPAEYKVQTAGRELNLFYLKDNLRARFEKSENGYQVVGTDIHFSGEAIISELQAHPERFSPNVVLRPLYQETILPNVAFIGGGGELAYWLELKRLFESAEVFFPVLVLRNSFLIAGEIVHKSLQKLNLRVAYLFSSDREITNKIISDFSDVQLSLNKQKNALQTVYRDVNQVSAAADVTLSKHVNALEVAALKRISALEKKIFRSQKRAQSDKLRQLEKLRRITNPEGGLQERHDNIFTFLSVYGPDFLKHLFKHSLALEQKFTVLEADAADTVH